MTDLILLNLSKSHVLTLHHRRRIFQTSRKKLEKSARKDFNDDQKTLIQYFRMVQERKLDEETTLEKDASVTDWQLNDMISFQNETILIRLSLIVQYFDFFSESFSLETVYISRSV